VRRENVSGKAAHLRKRGVKSQKNLNDEAPRNAFVKNARPKKH
jgi:hypothetical protein